MASNSIHVIGTGSTFIKWKPLNSYTPDAVETGPVINSKHSKHATPPGWQNISYIPISRGLQIDETFDDRESPHSLGKYTQKDFLGVDDIYRNHSSHGNPNTPVSHKSADITHWDWNSRFITTQQDQFVTLHDLNLRREKRKTRNRPWQTGIDQQKKEEEPPGRNQEKEKDAKDKIRNNFRDKPFKLETQDWLLANDFRIWLMEKEKSVREKIEANKGFVTRVSRTGGKLHRRNTGTGADQSIAYFAHGPDAFFSGTTGMVPDVAGSPTRKGKKSLSRRNTQSKKFQWVGPHQDLYQQYRHRELRHEKREIYAVEMQRFVRGWVQRSRLRRLKTRVLLHHASSWARFVRDYKGLLTRIQKRNGVKNPQMPFDVVEVNTFLDKKEVYEAAFCKLAEGSRLGKDKLRAYFTECGLNPEEADIKEVFGNVFRGCGSQGELVFIVDVSSSVGHVNFGLQQEFAKDLVSSLHIGEENVRVAYIPYNTEVYQSFDLTQFESKEQVNRRIDMIRLRRGLTNTHLALEKLRNMMKKQARVSVPRVAILITDGESSDTIATEREAELVRRSGIRLFAIGIGRAVDPKEIFMLAYDRDHMHLIDAYSDLPSLKSNIMKKADFVSCQYCTMLTIDEEERTSRGLFKEEVMELTYMLYPPEPTGLKPRTRSIKVIIEEEEEP